MGNEIVVIHDDILNAPIDQVICHQCNCISNDAAGLAKSIFKKFPWCNTYNNRSIRSKPGTIEICSGDSRHVINMYAQYYPGKPTISRMYDVDSVETREKYFKQCLDEILKTEFQKFAFPNKIGCGLAKGNWNKYLIMLKNFVKYKEVFIYEK